MGLTTTARRAIDWQVSYGAWGSEFRWRREGRDFVAEWVGVLTVRADAAGNVLAVQPTPGAHPDEVDRLERGGSQAFARWLAGRPSLHAAAVAQNGRALALVGPSGAGKSTLAAELCTLPGVELLSDDILLLKRAGARWLAEPTESSCRLGTEVGEAKQRIPVREVSVRSAVLEAIVDLRFHEAPTVELGELHGGDAFSPVASALLRFEATAEHWKRELDNLVQIGAHVRICKLARPRDLSNLRASAERVLHGLFESGE